MNKLKLFYYLLKSRMTGRHYGVVVPRYHCGIGFDVVELYMVGDEYYVYEWIGEKNFSPSLLSFHDVRFLF